jgi:ketosteroid isomerase-like protein
MSVEAVEDANGRFYRAFESLDLAEMDTVWSHDEHVTCVHPGWHLLVGWDEVRASWETIFKNTAEIRFTLSDVRVVVRDLLGWVTCVENILSSHQGRIAVTSVLATNLFERDGPEWRIVHHHASHLMTPPQPG